MFTRGRRTVGMGLSILACIGSLAEEPALPGPLRTESPLRGRIAFSVQMDGYWQIGVWDMDNGKQMLATTSNSDKRSPTWSPDGKHISYRTTDGTMESLELASRKVTPLVPMLGFMVDPRISPDGKSLAFARFESTPSDNTDLYIYRFEDKELKRITSEPTLEYAPAWSPDGRQLAYIGGRGRQGHLLRIIDVTGGKARILQPDPSDDMWPCWSPDGQWIYFSSSRTGDYEICRVRPTGADLFALTASPGLDTAPCAEPDGQWLIFCSNRGQKLRLWIMRTDGSQVQPLSPETTPMREPVWWQSPANAEVVK